MLAQEKVRETSFETQLSGYKSLIDTRVGEAAENLVAETIETRGVDAAIPIQAYSEILSRGGKRIRGLLTICGYELYIGQDRQVAVDAACAVEMLHAHVLIQDDIQDRSGLRRGGPTAHKILEQQSDQLAWQGPREHTGLSLALNASYEGLHYAQKLLRGLDVPAERRLRAEDLIDDTMIMTSHGQTLDIINQVSGQTSWRDAEKVMELKTTHYTVRAPLQLGMILAGASDKNFKKVEPYARHLGRAYQIKDDLLPYTTDSSGKDHAGDIKEGKVNLVILNALACMDPNDAKYLRSCLGNRDLTDAQFEKCKKLLIDTGTISFLENEAEQSIKKAVKATTEMPGYFNQNTIRFLGSLAEDLLHRDS